MQHLSDEAITGVLLNHDGTVHSIAKVTAAAVRKLDISERDKKTLVQGLRKILILKGGARFSPCEFERAAMSQPKVRAF